MEIDPKVKNILIALYTKAMTKSEGPKNFLAAPFLIPFSQQPAVKKGIKNGAARKNFGASYFVTALACHCNLF